jgi:hypothetical protein
MANVFIVGFFYSTFFLIILLRRRTNIEGPVDPSSSNKQSSKCGKSFVGKNVGVSL